MGGLVVGVQTEGERDWNYEQRVKEKRLKLQTESE